MENSLKEKYRPRTLPILEIEKETPKAKTFYVKSPEIASKSEPGQFLMLWIIGSDEIPISISKTEENGRIGLTVEKIGDSTSRLHELREGELIGIRGPYGNGFDLTGDNLLMICGGCGAAPLAFSAEKAISEDKKVTAILAAKDSEHLLFRSRLKNLGVNLIIATEDGSAGIKGLATDALKKEIKKWDFDDCLICGPELMMKKAAEILKNKRIPSQLSLERYMKCGIGICGQCTIDPSGLRVCKEGPIFRYEEIENSELGKYCRDSRGLKENF